MTAIGSRGLVSHKDRQGVSSELSVILLLIATIVGAIFVYLLALSIL